MTLINDSCLAFSVIAYHDGKKDPNCNCAPNKLTLRPRHNRNRNRNRNRNHNHVTAPGVGVEQVKNGWFKGGTEPKPLGYVAGNFQVSLTLNHSPNPNPQP